MAAACLLVVGLVAGPAFLADDAHRERRRARPNVLVIITDDQRAVGTMAVMPHTRRFFGKGGTHYPYAFTTTPLCCPSRVSIFTGQYVHNHGLERNNQWEFDQSETIQRRLDETGYRTAIFGKYLNAWNLEDDPPHFDEWAINAHSADALTAGGEWNVDGRLRTVNRYSTDYISRRALQFLDESESDDDGPWMMLLSLNAPHAPYEPAPKYVRAEVPQWEPARSIRERDRSDKPPYVRNSAPDLAKAKLIRSGQLRTLMSVDDMVRRLGVALSRLNEDRNTLVVFMSDNGFLWNEHGLVGSVNSKHNPYSQSINVPLYLRYPDRGPRRPVDRRLAATIDLVPTIVDAARLPEDPSHILDGESLLEPSRRNHLLVEYAQARLDGAPDWASLRTRTDQYVEYYDRSGGITFREYYDLDNDPFQERNLLGRAGDRPLLHRALRRARTCAGDSCP